ncbi:MAG: DUF3105 domain-containing protein [Candidatus Promineifilaceae bacterium]
MSIESNRISRKQERQQKLSQEKRKRRLTIIVSVVAVILALGTFAFLQLRPVEGTSNFGAQERGHDAGTTFTSTGRPPVGGDHNPQFQNCGIYTQPVDTSLALHSMEHGAVWIAYSPDLPAEDVAILQNLVRGETNTLLSPYPDLDSDVIATAWGVQLEPDSVADERLEQFINRYRGGGPEPGAPCSGGVNRTIQQ